MRGCGRRDRHSPDLEGEEPPLLLVEDDALHAMRRRRQRWRGAIAAERRSGWGCRQAMPESCVDVFRIMPPTQLSRASLFSARPIRFTLACPHFHFAWPSPWRNLLVHCNCKSTFMGLKLLDQLAFYGAYHNNRRVKRMGGTAWGELHGDRPLGQCDSRGGEFGWILRVRLRRGVASSSDL